MTTPLLPATSRTVFRVLDPTTKQHVYAHTLLDARRRAGEWFDNRGSMPGTTRTSPESLFIELLDLGSMSVMRVWTIGADLTPRTLLDSAEQAA